MLEFYRVDLADVFTGATTPSRIWRLLSVLPDTARLPAMLRAAPDYTPGRAPVERWREFHGWGRDRFLAADLWNAVVGVAPREKGAKPPTYPVPGAKAKGTPLSSLMPRRPN